VSVEITWLPGELFSCLHRGDGPAQSAALLVPPLFGEYIQHHRAYHVLAERLAARGVPALRYDHAGTGDSGGDLADVDVLRWVQDIVRVAQELIERSGARRIHLIGARMGAALAVAAAPKLSRLSSLVLWQPVWHPVDHLDEMVTHHRRELGRYLTSDQERLPDDSGTWDVLGFRIGASLWKELRAFEPDPSGIADDVDVAVFANASSLNGWQAPDGYGRWAAIPVEHPRGWLEPEDGIYDVLVPSGVVYAIADWIGQRT
jgi:pimeloyl-ACP methyl ester carboxylesterase